LRAFPIRFCITCTICDSSAKTEGSVSTVISASVYLIGIFRIAIVFSATAFISIKTNSLP
jgi:hypothetical protein